MRDDGAIKVSRALKSLNLQINKYIEEYVGKNQAKPSIEELAKHFAVDEQEIIMAMDSSKMPVSLSAPLEDGDLSVSDRVEADSPDLLDELALKEVVKSLGDRDRKIILLRYYFDRTQSEIARELHISQVQVSRLENKILENLRQKMN